MTEIRKVATRFRLLTGGAMLAVMSGCTDWAGHDLDMFWGNFPFLSTMRESVSYDAYDMPRLPVVGTVPAFAPVGEMPAPFTQLELETVAAGLTNPLQRSPEVLQRGEVLYLRHCSACHGPQGEGNGPVVGPGRFPFATPVNAGVAVGRTDGYLYGIIRAGRGLMPSYAERTSHEDRWAMVHYMRQLQGQPATGPVIQPIEVQEAPAGPLGSPTPQTTNPGAVPVDTAQVQ